VKDSQLLIENLIGFRKEVKLIFLVICSKKKKKKKQIKEKERNHFHIITHYKGALRGLITQTTIHTVIYKI